MDSFWKGLLEAIERGDKKILRIKIIEIIVSNTISCNNRTHLGGQTSVESLVEKFLPGNSHLMFNVVLEKCDKFIQKNRRYS